MRNAIGFILKAIAGTFFYTAGILGFVIDESLGAGKAVLLLIFAFLGVLPLVGGLAVTRFVNWKKDIGIVLLCTAAWTALSAISVASIFATEDFMDLMPPGLKTFTFDYITGGVIVLGYAFVGWVLFNANTKNISQPATAEQR